MNSTDRIRTCVFPVAGLGTRMLPATKSLPKEMLPVVDKPIVQYALEEAAEAGIERFVFVTGRGKAMIEDHFDRAYELFQTLREKAKTEALEKLEAEIVPAGCVTYTRQQEPLGLGHVAWNQSNDVQFKFSLSSLRIASTVNTYTCDTNATVTTCTRVTVVQM